MSLGLLSLLINTAQAVPLSSVNAGELVVSEIMHDPASVADYRGEYIEIHNTLGVEVDINGLVVNTSNEAGFTVNQSIIVPAGGYVVLGASSNSGNNGGNGNVDFQYSYSSFKLGKNDSVTISDGSTTFDTVSYTASTFPISGGAAMILNTGSLDSTSNDTASNWCISSNVFGDGDFGTPGSANDGCSTVADISVGDLVITEIMWDPTTVADYRGEWIEIYNASSGSLNLNGLQINSTGNTGHTVSSDLVVASGGQVLLNVRSTTSVNGGTTGDYTYSYSEVNFGKNDSVTLVAGATTVDSVTYTFAGFPVANGKSITLSPSVLTATGNDSAANWCEATSTYGDGDFGTPGLTNDVCDNVDGDGDGLAASVDCDDSDPAIGVITYFRDADSDTFGDDLNTTTACSVPAGYVEIGGDCDDSKSDVNPDATEVCDDIDNDCNNDIDDADAGVDTSTGPTFYADSDNDTFGDDTVTQQQCDVPAGFVSIPGDCNDSDNTINPSGNDIANNGIDENCDGVDNNGGDNDGDGFTVAGGDCNDNNSAIFPGAAEVCDSVDNDCNGDIDDDDAGVTGTTTFFLDNDGDGFAGFSTVSACTQPANSFVSQTDCNDSNASRFPNAPEIVNDGLDQDCDNGDLCYVDSDDDGFRTDNTVSSADMDCTDSGEGETADPLDCDDSSASVNPSASEVCDGVDNDCDGDVDDADSGVDTSGGTVFFADTDNDLYGDAGNTLQTCSRPSGYVTNSLDCDDTDNQLKPVDGDGDGVDRCNNDCDDTDADAFPGSAETESAVDCMSDADSDGYGDTSAPSGGVSGTDCDDTDGAVNPGASEVCDGLDNDCDTDIDDADSSLTGATTWFADSDTDTFGDSNTTQNTCIQPAGFVTDNTDCDDTDGAINPSATEVCDSVDNDCDNDIDDADSSVTGTSTFFTDGDNDGFGGSSTVEACSQPVGTFTTTTDCDDSDGAVNPGATEVCDGIDNDCDNDIDDADAGVDLGSATTWFADSDTDTFGDSGTSSVSCSQPAGFVTDNTDCDDTDGAINPSATEVCDSVDNDCDNDIDDADSSVTGTSTFFTDGDNDGFGGSSTVEACSQPVGTFTTTTDCDDSDGAVNPGATEVCDGIDNDCDTDIDEGTGGNTFFQDSDNDGFGDSNTTTDACSAPAGFVTDNTDCDDTDGSVNPNATEICLDGIDSDCDNTDSLGSCTGTVANDDFTITGVSAGDRLGQALSYGGNITGSSTPDFVLGSRWNGSENGAVYVFAGSNSLSGAASASSADVTITGTGSERFGFSVAGGTSMLGGINADFNGDGNDDLLVGAPNADVGGSAIGSAYVFYGPLTADTTSASASAVFTGQFGQDASTPSNHNAVNTGYAVAFVGDINNDGIGDIAIGDPSKKNSGSTNGEAYLIFGRADTFDGGGAQLTSEYEGVTSLNEASWRAQLGREILSDGTGREQMGAAIDAIGDVNGDGIDDLAVGAYRWDQSSSNPNQNNGAVFVWYGGTNLVALDQLLVSHSGGSNTADFTVVGSTAGDQIGRSLSGAGDFNGDGNLDIVIGSEHANSDSGLVMIVDGTGSTITTFTGENADDAAGRWVSTIGDINGDGASEVLVGAKLADANGVDSGATYVILGGAGVTGTNSFSTAEVFLSGDGGGHETGINVSGLDDMDGDGISEILIGSYKTNSDQGAVQLILGSTFQ